MYSCGARDMDEQMQDWQLCADRGCIPEDLPEAMDDIKGISVLLVQHDDDESWFEFRIYFRLHRLPNQG